MLREVTIFHGTQIAQEFRRAVPNRKHKIRANQEGPRIRDTAQENKYIKTVFKCCNVSLGINL